MRNDNFASVVNKVVENTCAVSLKDGQTNGLDNQCLLWGRIKKGGESTRNIVAEIPHPSGVPSYWPPSHFGTEDRSGVGWSRRPGRPLSIMPLAFEADKSLLTAEKA